MAETTIAADIAELRQCLNRIKSLLAWRTLKVLEARPEQMYSFTLDDHVDEDLRNECTIFIGTSQRLREMAASHGVAGNQDKRLLLCTLCRLQREFMSLPIAADGSSYHFPYCQNGLL